MLVLTDDPVLERHVLSVVAAVGLGTDQPSDDTGVRAAWRSAAAVLVGRDRADGVVGLALPARPEVYVLGRDDDGPETFASSARMRAVVATLPSGAPDLAAALSSLGDAGRGSVLALVGAVGGVGTSTLAAALAGAAARAGLRTLLVDTDLAGGGLDVLLGAEHLAGWRWSRFAAARGHLGDLAGQLPQCDGVDVLAADRASRPGAALGADQLAAVVDAGARSHDLTVVDLPRGLEVAHDEVLRRSARVLVVVRADVRGVAGADHAARALEPRCRELEVVVRTGRGHGLDPSLVAEALGLPLAGVLEEDHGLAAAAERGEPPGRASRSSIARLCDALLAEHLEVAA